MARRLPEFLRQPEAEALLKAAHRDRDRLILLVGLGAGLRCSEIVHLRIEDIDLAEETLFVRMGKGRKDRYVCLPAFLIEALRAWIAGRTVGWLFPSPRKPDAPLTRRAVQYLAARLKKAAGILRRCNPHVLRHTFATTLLRNGADITEIAQLLGHSSPAVTARTYLHCDVEKLKSVVARLSFGRAANAPSPQKGEGSPTAAPESSSPLPTPPATLDASGAPPNP